jgi:MscS family membrane protein
MVILVMMFPALIAQAATSSPDPISTGLPALNLAAHWKSLLWPTVIFFALYTFVFVILRTQVRKLRSDAAIVALRVSQIPVLVIGITWLLELFLLNLKGYPFFVILNRGLTGVIVLTLTIWANRIIKEVLIYTLKEVAQVSEQQWDDVLVPFLETTLPIIVYVGGIITFLQAIGVDLSPVLVTLGGVGFIVGLAVKPTLQDLFSGLFLLVDSPFRFGDVIAWTDDSQAIIKKIGLRMTVLYMIDQHCDMYVPNGTMQSQAIRNLTRPTSNYYYTLKVPVKSDSDPSRVVSLIESIILAHPDTLGDVNLKLEKISEFYGLSGAIPNAAEKREVGTLRLLAEKELNVHLSWIEKAFDDLSDKISQMEEGGLDIKEIRQIQDSFLEICRRIGLEVSSEQLIRKQKLELRESAKAASTESLIGSVRNWYQTWLKDPNLISNDLIELPTQWEQKINLLKLKINKAFKRVNKIDVDETRLDTLLSGLPVWMKENFKTTRNEWQNPKVWVSEFSFSQRNYSVRFYIDDITLEYYQRGKRVENEVNQELTWQLRLAYLAA